MNLLIGLLIGILIAGVLDGAVIIYVLYHPALLHKLIKLLPGNLIDKIEGEFDVGYYGSDDDCCQDSCNCDKQWSESEPDNYNGA